MDFYQKFKTKLTRKKYIKTHIELKFLRRLNHLLKHGYSLIRALDLMGWDKQLEHITNTIRTCLIRGDPIDITLQNASFHPYITEFLYFVRHNANLQENLQKCIYMYEQRLSFTKKFTQTIRYPIVLIIMFLVIFFFIRRSVLPSFTGMIHDQNNTQLFLNILIKIMDISITTSFFLCIAIFICYLIWPYIKSSFSLQRQIKIISHIPLYSAYKQTHLSFLFATHFSSLLKAGLSIKDVLAMMSQHKKSAILAYYATSLTNQLENGGDLSTHIRRHRLFSKQIADIFRHHTNNKDLEIDLTMYAEFLTKELKQKLTKVITYIQPIVFSIIGLFIIIIYITIMWPMLQLLNTL